ncbi:MAG: LysE family translocator [Gemmatimonadetes bacterium]|jgi:threonine/homoserine/homoserine lactone efflux protein|nr:LysE family translocator [Gemmatimonadota bacterium]MBT5059987.1 LysE family translocator [Gemmatimonadota bacterium]MBT5142083.1 LysE family translocator [Gemmatimonadota bacterium]MBT5588483.1 LysE family translocator [Gemmatimonadota bacterium]MBT5963018.1 LysE family translocator [Gemmatimonadota bacterium]
MPETTHLLGFIAAALVVLLTSATAFGVVKTLGAGYLIYLGIRALLARDEATDSGTPTPRSLRQLFTNGVIVSVLNPKIAVFFLAFLPQFVDPTRGPVPQQVMLLGFLYIGLSLLTDSAYVLLASRLRLLGGRWATGRSAQYASGVVYIGLGVSTAFSRR